MKTCSKCQTPKPRQDFVREPRSKDGRGSICKACNRDRRRELYDSEAKRQYYQTRRGTIRQAQADYYQDNRASLQSRALARYTENREAILAQKRQAYQANPDLHRERNRQKQARWRSRLDAYKRGGCADCGRSDLPPCCMDFDHRPGTRKVAGVGNLYGASRLRLEAEVSKCDLVCRVCHRLRTDARRPPRKQMNPALEVRISWYNEAKSQPCSRCGSRFPPAAMDFHHRDPATKVAGLALLVRVASLKRLQAEVQKCDLLCANCHALEHKI